MTQKSQVSAFHKACVVSEQLHEEQEATFERTETQEDEQNAQGFVPEI